MGDFFQLTCAVVHGDAPFNITWYFNEEPLRFDNDEGIMIMMHSKRSSSLNIENVQGKHAGKYTCMGANQAGYNTVSSNLTIKGLLC